MKRKYKFMAFYAFEYKVLEDYLRSMAQKGWKLVKLQGFLKNLMVFEKCEPQSIYYHVDYGAKYSIMYPNDATPSQIQYREFLEDYGYEFVSSNGPIDVYASREETILPIRDDDSVGHQEIKKIAKREFLLNFCLPLMYVFLAYQSFSGGEYSYYANTNLLSGIFDLIVAGIWLSTLFPYIHWLIHKKKEYKLRSVVIRTKLQIITILILIICLLTSFETRVGVFALITMIFSFLLVSFYKMFDSSEIPLKRKRIISVLSCIVLVYVFFMIMTNVLLSDMIRNNGVSENEQKGIVLTSIGMKKASAFEEESFVSKYISSYEEDGDKSFDYVVLKNTPFQKYLFSKIVRGMEYEKIDNKKGFTIYKSGYERIMIEKNYHMAIFLDEQVTDKLLDELDILFKK